MRIRRQGWHRALHLSLVLAGASLAACARAPQPQPDSIPALGISDLVVMETETALRITGVDATGATVAHLELTVGTVEVADFPEAPLGRLLALRVGTTDYRFPSAGRDDLYLPAPPEPELNQFLLAPAVAPILARWGIVFADLDEWALAHHPERGAPTAETEYSSVCYDPNHLGGGNCADAAGGCLGFNAPCGTAGARSTCADFAYFQGSTDIWTQLVQCNDNSRAIRLCTWAFTPTSCGMTGPNGCAPCGSSFSGPSGGQAICAGMCSWYDGGGSPPRCTSSGNSCSSSTDCCSNNCRTDYGMCVESGWGCCNGTCGAGIFEC